jgi:hypothetical protein
MEGSIDNSYSLGSRAKRRCSGHLLIIDAVSNLLLTENMKKCLQLVNRMLNSDFGVLDVNTGKEGETDKSTYTSVRINLEKHFTIYIIAELSIRVNEINLTHVDTLGICSIV